MRQRLVEQALQAAIERAKQKNRKAPKLDGEQEAHWVALACQESYETVRRVLEKHHQTLAA